jgi:hypothetical protein
LTRFSRDKVCVDDCFGKGWPGAQNRNLKNRTLGVST